LLEQPYLRYNCECGEDYVMQAVGTSQTFFSNPTCGIGLGGDWRNLCYQKNGFNIQLDPDATTCINTGDTSLYVATDHLISPSNFRLFPNPTKDFVHLELDLPQSGQYFIFSTNGKKIQQQSFQNKEKLEVDLSLLRQGIYFLYLQIENENFSFFKIIKI